MNVNSDKLLSALEAVESIFERRSAIPILTCVMLQEETSVLRVTATNMEIEIVVVIPLDGQPSDGELLHACPIASRLLKTVKNIDCVDLSIKRDGDFIVASEEGGLKAEIATLPAADFPRMSMDPLPKSFLMEAEDLLRCFQRVRRSMSKEETRYYLNGTFMHVVDGKLRFVSTDGHRLTYTDLPAPAELNNWRGIIVPRHAVKLIVDILEKEYEHTRDIVGVTVEITDSRFRIHVGNMIITTKVIDGTFPAYARVVPETTEGDVILTAPAGILRVAAEVIADFGREHITPVAIGYEDGGFYLRAKYVDEATVTLPLIATPGPGRKGEIGFQTRYIHDLLEHIVGTVSMAQAKEGGPVVFTVAEDPSWKGVLMPMRIS